MFNNQIGRGCARHILIYYKKLPVMWEKHKSKRTTASKVIAGYIQGFDPDYLVTVNDVSIEGIEFDSERILSYESVLSNFKNDLTPNIGAGIFEVIDHFQHEEMRFIRRKEFKFIQSKLSDRYKLFLSSLFGDVGEHEDVFYENYLNDFDVRQEDVNVNNYWEFFNRDMLYPRRVGSLYIEQRLQGPVIFYMDASKNLDVIDFWNLRAAGWEILPALRQSSDDKNLLAQCEKLIEEAYWPYRSNPNIFHYASIIKSRSLKEKEAEEFRNKLNIKKYDHKKGPKLSLQWWYPRLWDEWARENAQEKIMPAYSRETEIELQEGQSEFRFKTLDPKFDLFYGSSGEPRFALEVDANVYGSEEFLAEVIPPGSADVARAIDKYSMREWRISKSGPVYLSSHQDWRLSYKVPLAAYSGDSDHPFWFYSITRSPQRDELMVSL